MARRKGTACSNGLAGTATLSPLNLDAAVEPAELRIGRYEFADQGAARRHAGAGQGPRLEKA